MKINLPPWIKSKSRHIDINPKQVKKSSDTAPLNEGLYHFHKDRKIQTFSDARTITRVLNESESGQKRDISLAFEEALLKIFQKYPDFENLNGVERILATEKVTAALKYFIEILVIRNYKLNDSLKEQVEHYLKFYKIPESKKLQVLNIINVLNQNKEDLDIFDNYLQGDSSSIFFQIFLEKLSNYPSLKIKKGSIGYEISGSHEDINKLYKSNKKIGGFATYRNFGIKGKDIRIYLNFFIEGNRNAYSHELQHNINHIFIHFLNEGVITDPLLIIKKIGKNPELEKRILKESYASIHKNLLASFGNEVLAQLRGEANIEDIKKYMQPSPNGSQFYNYLERFDSNNLSSVRGINEYYYYSDKEDKVYPSIKVISEEDLNKYGLRLLNINPNSNLEARNEFKQKFESDILRILRALEIITKKDEVDIKNVINILSLNPVNKWEKLLKDLAIPNKRIRLLEQLRKYLTRDQI